MSCLSRTAEPFVPCTPTRRANSSRGARRKPGSVAYTGRMAEQAAAQVWLWMSALAAGVVNSIAGGGTLLTFPALMALGTAVMANATSTVALVPGSVAGAWGYRRELRSSARWARVLVWPSVVGGAIGALLVTRLPERYFAVAVPWLILSAAVLLLLQPVLSRLAGSGRERVRPQGVTLAAVSAAQLVVAIYGGYFGAGIGILMLGVLGLARLGDIHEMNALKTLLAACINAVAVVVFVAERRVDWHLAPGMAVAAVAGGYLGARAARRLNRTLVRWIVVAIGFGLAAYFFGR